MEEETIDLAFWHKFAKRLHPVKKVQKCNIDDIYDDTESKVDRRVIMTPKDILAETGDMNEEIMILRRMKKRG